MEKVYINERTAIHMKVGLWMTRLIKKELSLQRTRRNHTQGIESMVRGMVRLDISSSEMEHNVNVLGIMIRCMELACVGKRMGKS